MGATTVSFVAQLVKNLPAVQETWVRSPGEGKGPPLQYSCLENSMDCVVPGVTKSQIRLSAFHSLCFALACGFVSLCGFGLDLPSPWSCGDRR